MSTHGQTGADAGQHAILTFGRWVGLLAGALGPAVASAHSFGPVFTLPLPFWMYAWGAASAIVLSFLIAALMLGADAHRAPVREWRLAPPVGRAARHLLGGVALSLLLLCVASALFGVPRAYKNISMTLFWVVFLVGMPYACAVLGNVYRWLNPWRSLARATAAVWPGYERPVYSLSSRYRYLPAIIALLGVIWVELFAGASPRVLGGLLMLYTVVTLLGVGLYGARQWFFSADIFAVLMRLMGALAPLRWAREGVYLRWPALGVERLQGADAGLVFLILAWLATTAFDGLHETALWHRWFFVDLYHAVLKAWVGENPLAAYPQMRAWFSWWQGLWLLLLPCVYGAVYWLFMQLSRWCAGGGAVVGVLGRRYAPTLLPIVLAYHIAHYYTLLQTQGVKVVALISDPFGWGWNLVGTARWMQRTIIPDVETVWSVQLGAIVLGHIASVFLAHRQALQLYENRWIAARSQIPMLVLMVVFTVGGLWILSLPPVR